MGFAIHRNRLATGHVRPFWTRDRFVGGGNLDLETIANSKVLFVPYKSIILSIENMWSLTAAAKEARAALVRLDRKQREEGGAGGGGRGVVSGEPRSLFVPSHIKNEAMAKPIQSPPLKHGDPRSQLEIDDPNHKETQNLSDDRVGNTKISDQIWQLEEFGNCLVVDPNVHRFTIK